MPVGPSLRTTGLASCSCCFCLTVMLAAAWSYYLVSQGFSRLPGCLADWRQPPILFQNPESLWDFYSVIASLLLMVSSLLGKRLEKSTSLDHRLYPCPVHLDLFFPHIFLLFSPRHRPCRTLMIFNDTSRHLLNTYYVSQAQAKFLTYIASLSHHYHPGRTVVSPLFTWDIHRRQVDLSRTTHAGSGKARPDWLL